MSNPSSSDTSDTNVLFKSLGLPNVQIHRSINHFDFTKPARRILVIGSMGSGKTEYSARIWRDAKVALHKSPGFAHSTITAGADRRQVFFIRSMLDTHRFPDYPGDALAYRGGYERLGDSLAKISDSFDLEKIMAANPGVGTWILDEASFYDERLSYLTKRESEARGLVFVFPTLILNFRNEIFNSTARLLLDNATDVFPLSAYCEHRDCMTDSFFSYRYYRVDGKECPALYFDPLVIVGGDNIKEDPREPNYCTRCDRHHYLPGKEYTYLVLKPLGLEAAWGKSDSLMQELYLLKHNIKGSALAQSLRELHGGREGSGSGDVDAGAEAAGAEAAADADADGSPHLNALLVPDIAEKALIYLFMEQNLISDSFLNELMAELQLDEEYISRRLRDAGRVLHRGKDDLFGTGAGSGPEVDVNA